jgi:hypothetical protein
MDFIGIGGPQMQARRSVLGTALAAILFIATLAGLLLTIPGSAEIRLSGEMLAGFAREHPPKPWRGFEATVQGVTIDSEVHIKAHVTGHLIHTPVEVSGTPLYDPQARVMFFHVSKVELPHEASRPMLGELNKVLTPFGTSIAKHMTDVIPVKHLKPEKRGEAVFMETVKSVRVDNGAVVLGVHGYFMTAATGALMLAALASAIWFIVSLLPRRSPEPDPQP